MFRRVVWSVSRSAMTVRIAKAAEWIEMPFGMWTWVGPRNYVQGCKRDLSLRDQNIRFWVRDETKTKTFMQFHETETRPRRLIFATRRDRDFARLRARHFSRPPTFNIVPKQ